MWVYFLEGQKSTAIVVFSMTKPGKLLELQLLILDDILDYFEFYRNLKYFILKIKKFF